MMRSEEVSAEPARLILILMSPRSSSNSVISSSLRNFMSSLISFRFIRFQPGHARSSRAQENARSEPRKPPKSERNQFFARVRQDLATCFRDYDGIFDAHSPFSRKINSRLNRDYHAGLQDFFSATAYARRLVNLQAQAMPG